MSHGAMTSLWTPLDRPLSSLRTIPPPEFVETFLNGMPETYRVQHSASEVTDHAAIAWRRRGELAHLEQWAAGAKDAMWLCVVTDDRPGLLTLLSAAITAHSLNIVRAKIYCRDTTDNKREAVDFFCVRPLKSETTLRMDEAEILGIRDTVIKLLEGQTDIPTLERRASPTSRPPGRPDTSIYFDGERNGTDLLVIETDDHPGLLTAVTRVLSTLELSIQWSEVVTMAGRARDEFQLLDENGQRLSPRRKQSVVADVSTTVTKLLLSGRE
jgi:UTP:GlnB (protein PII) uridylyltransferase